MREIQQNFRPALGFVQRDNVRLFRTAFSFNPRPKDFLNLQQMFHDFYYTQFTRLEPARSRAGFLHDAARLALQVGRQPSQPARLQRVYERLFEPFEISPGVVLRRAIPLHPLPQQPASTATKRRLSASINMLYGGYWSGRPTGTPPPPSGCRRPQACQHQPDIRQAAGGHFTARIFTPTPTTRPRRARAHEPDSVRQPIAQSRMAEPPALDAAPGNDLFVSFNQGWIQEKGAMNYGFV